MAKERTPSFLMEDQSIKPFSKIVIIKYLTSNYNNTKNHIN